jgi:hypothetical protein
MADQLTVEMGDDMGRIGKQGEDLLELLLVGARAEHDDIRM